MSHTQHRQDPDRIRVLHLDDNSDYLALAAEFLQRVGSFDVVSETDADAALEWVRRGAVDCVVSDFDMPGTDGLAFFSAVCEIDTTVPFILFTGKGSEEIASDAISAGVTDYVQKRGGREQYDVLANRVENAVERAQAAAQSRETADRLHETFDRITDSFLAIDADWRITYVNDRGASFLGGSASDLLGRDLRSLPANGAARFHEEYQEALESQESVSFEAESLTHPGRWLDIRAYPAEDGLSIYWRDVTTLRRRERLLAAFFESSGEPVVRVRFEDDHARIDRVNAAFERVFGLDASEVDGVPLDELIVPPGERAAALELNEQSTEGEPVEAEIRRLTPSGPREFLFRSVPFRGNDDAPMAYGIYIDITARKRREQTLERYRTIVESTGDPVYTLDADGVITYVNEAFGAMTGYDPEALVGENMSSLVTDADVERSETLIRALLADDERTNDTVELDLRHADGTLISCENHIALLPFDEEFQGTAGSIRDITERKARKRELKAQNERLEEFASVVSHDLRNPLQVAQGHLELAREGFDGDDESLARVESALDRIDAIVGDVLTLAREGDAASDVSEIVVADVAQRAWESVDTADARIVVETEMTVDADEKRLQRLFENLFRNAVEHGSTSNRPAAGDRVEHGSTNSRAQPVDSVEHTASSDDEPPSVTVRVGHVRDENGRRAFFVEDDGTGIAPGEREQVFETGYSTSSDGTGFGLDIVDTIATSHDWEITLSDSTLGGARFEFYLRD